MVALLTLVFEHFGISLQKKVGVQMVDEIGNNTLMGCGFKLVKGAHVASEQGSRTPFPPVPGSSSSEPSVDALLLDQSRLKTGLRMSSLRLRRGEGSECQAP